MTNDIRTTQIHTLRIAMEFVPRWCIHLLHPRIRNFNHWLYHLRTRFLVHHLDLLDCFVSSLPTFFQRNCQSIGREGGFQVPKRTCLFWEILYGRESSLELHTRRIRNSKPCLVDGIVPAAVQNRARARQELCLLFPSLRPSTLNREGRKASELTSHDRLSITSPCIYAQQKHGNTDSPCFVSTQRRFNRLFPNWLFHMLKP